MSAMSAYHSYWFEQKTKTLATATMNSVIVNGTVLFIMIIATIDSSDTAICPVNRSVDLSVTMVFNVEITKRRRQFDAHESVVGDVDEDVEGDGYDGYDGGGDTSFWFEVIFVPLL
jgi:hypothetical protein